MQVSDLSDSSEVYALEKRLMITAETLAGMVKGLGKARQIREFASDRKKQILAKCMSTFLGEGESAAAAEAKARASFLYDEEMTKVAQQLASAEEAIAAWEATKTIWESCRSLLALQRTMSQM